MFWRIDINEYLLSFIIINCEIWTMGDFYEWVV